MSSGAFVKGYYQADNGVLHPIRCQPETTQATLGANGNLFPDENEAGVTKSKISARTGKGKREKGLGPRTVTIVFGITDGSYPDGYKPGGITTIPVFLKETWDLLGEGSQVTYQGKQCQISYLSPESVK